jgi:hypothetical protein
MAKYLVRAIRVYWPDGTFQGWQGQYRATVDAPWYSLRQGGFGRKIVHSTKKGAELAASLYLQKHA